MTNEVKNCHQFKLFKHQFGFLVKGVDLMADLVLELEVNLKVGVQRQVQQ